MVASNDLISNLCAGTSWPWLGPWYLLWMDDQVSNKKLNPNPYPVTPRPNRLGVTLYPWQRLADTLEPAKTTKDNYPARLVPVPAWPA